MRSAGSSAPPPPAVPLAVRLASARRVPAWHRGVAYPRRQRARAGPGRRERDAQCVGQVQAFSEGFTRPGARAGLAVCRAEVDQRAGQLQPGRRATQHVHGPGEQLDAPASALGHSGGAQDDPETPAGAPLPRELDFLLAQPAGCAPGAQRGERQRSVSPPAHRTSGSLCPTAPPTLRPQAVR